MIIKQKLYTMKTKTLIALMIAVAAVGCKKEENPQPGVNIHIKLDSPGRMVASKFFFPLELQLSTISPEIRLEAFTGGRFYYQNVSGFGTATVLVNGEEHGKIVLKEGDNEKYEYVIRSKRLK